MRSGGDAVLGKREGGHRIGPVYTEMLRQVARDYSGLPDPRSLTLGEIRWWYQGLRAELHAATKPRPQAPTAAPKPVHRPRMRRT